MKYSIKRASFHEFIDFAIQKNDIIIEDLSKIIKLEKVSWQNIAGSLNKIVSNIHLIIDYFNKINSASTNTFIMTSNFQVKDIEDKLNCNLLAIQNILNKFYGKKLKNLASK
ncbi:hypothetical protein BpHYR1_030467 [Brachionus plicatilis]|uniref:Uncharacterized protein n=1 Tax=Brachionus plicatilis TaxID=10195 RepID=A0A3M7RWZ7_BRAPC|nr:hypothetical protein BpHYR1_030467 [Brachionus plicatilis]